MLAFVKLRAAGGDKCLGEEIEHETRRIIHERAAELDPALLKDETRRIRLALQHKRSRPHRKNEIDIKYGEGGMLDVYFAMRYLQLRDNIPDDTNDRTTRYMLRQLHANGSISNTTFSEMLPSYEFLSELDHNLRLTVGRTTRVPVANTNTLNTIAKRLDLKDHTDLLEELALHRLTIRTAFDNILTA